MKKHFCDHCGQEITRSIAKVKVGKSTISLGAIGLDTNDYKNFDICFKCQIEAMHKALGMTDKKYLELHVDDLNECEDNLDD